ncbi:hypothetical protein [Arcanobacterium phocae]|uniref:hypothetical protein n=1 Tax=Arcanobacterium phocae TaxID=131112 RepID=UPI001C0ECCDB|nr:hypothetical protein [Arcanobacterium phocae]
MKNQQQSRPYVPDYDWLWTQPPSYTRTLRAIISHSDAAMLRTAFTSFIRSLQHDENGVAGRGGWAIYPNVSESEPHAVVADIVSGGEDVADAICDGADELFEKLTATPGIKIQWRQLDTGATKSD